MGIATYDFNQKGSTVETRSTSEESYNKTLRWVIVIGMVATVATLSAGTVYAADQISPNIPTGPGAPQNTGELTVIPVPNYPYVGQEGYTPTTFKGNAITVDPVPETSNVLKPSRNEIADVPRETTYYSRDLTKSNIINAKIDLAFGFRNNITFVPDFRVDMFKGLDQRIYSTEIVNVNGEYYKFIVRAIGMGVGGQYLETGKEMNSFLLINTPKGINTSGLLFKFNNITEVKALIIKHGVKIQFDQNGKVLSHLNPTGILEADINDFYQLK
jgi:hypothetical protein